jgi:tripartite ATP-independent transporter DctM subunit
MVGLTLGFPVFVALGLSTYAPYFSTGEARSIMVMGQRLFAGIDRFNLLAVPMFVLAGNIMTVSGIMDKLLGVAHAFVGWIRGGLAQVNILGSMLFAGISGSAVADTVALGSILVPAMEKDGYDKGFAGAVTAASAIVGPIIPPSNVMIIYGATFGVPIGVLFAAGFVPGIAVGVSMMILTFFISIIQKHPKHKPMGWKKFWLSLLHGIIPMAMPIIILGGIFSGVFTATEASAIAVLYALIIGLFVYRTLHLKQLYELLLKSAKTCAGTILILAFSQNFGWILARHQVPQIILAAVVSVTQSPILILLLVNLFLFVVGLFIGRTVALLILGPILIPMLALIGLHQLHIAMILIFALGVGHLTPPFGLLLYTTAYAGNVKFERIVAQVPPYVILLLVINMIVTFVPEFVMFFPRFIGVIR